MPVPSTPPPSLLCKYSFINSTPEGLVAKGLEGLKIASVINRLHLTMLFNVLRAHKSPFDPGLSHSPRFSPFFYFAVAIRLIRVRQFSPDSIVIHRIASSECRINPSICRPPHSNALLVQRCAYLPPHPRYVTPLQNSFIHADQLPFSITRLDV